jgi:hypothetical protein
LVFGQGLERRFLQAIAEILSSPSSTLSTTVVLPEPILKLYSGNKAYSKLRLEMETNQTQLLEELQRLSLGLSNSNTLILKLNNGSTLCQFLAHGLVTHTVLVKCELLATALWQVSSVGIIDGTDFMIFKNAFPKFSLHIKARQLYAEFGVQQPELDLDLQRLLVA